MKNRLLRLLNIRTDEAWLVSNLFGLQFFQGVGVAIFNTVALTLFLTKFDVHELPKIYLFAALLLWITGYVYSKVEHALSIKKLVPLIICFVAFSIFAFRVGYHQQNSLWFFFLLFSWYYVVYLLTNLEFWGLAALQFDIRQSKRLFGMIGAGDIPAKLIGYSAVPFLVVFFSNQTMLMLSGVSILFSLVFYFRLKNAGKLDVHIAHEHTSTKAHATENVRSIIKGFFGNRMIAYVAFLSFLVVTCVTIISFSFYSEVKELAHNDKQLYGLIAAFFAGGRVFAILVRLVLTGRLANTLGNKGSLLISPIILFVFLIGIILLPFFTDNPHAVIYLFGLIAIITEVLKTSLQDPVFLSLMQPLSAHFRLKGHTIVKGVMDPFALAFSGFMLYTLMRVSGKVDLHLLSFLLLALLGIWVVMIFVVDNEYVRTLVTALNKRYSVGTELDLTDEKTRAVLQQKIAAGERGEAIYILNLIEKQYDDEKIDLIINALQHPAKEVKMEAIKLAERKKITAAIPYIQILVESGKENELLPELVKALCLLQPDELESLEVYIEDQDPRLMKAAIIGLMTSGGISAVVTAGQRLLLLLASALPEERKLAAEIIGELCVNSFYKPLLILLNDANESVVKAAIQASGNVKNEKLIAALMVLFLENKHSKLIVDALHQSGEVSLKEIKTALANTTLTRQQKSKLILLCGRIGSNYSTLILDELIWTMPHLRSDIFQALYLCDFKLPIHNRTKHIDLINQYIKAATKLVYMIDEAEKNTRAKTLVNALYLEFDEIRDSLLLLFSFVYDKEKMMKAKSAFNQKKKEGIANALEVIEIEVPKEISLKFNKLFEPSSMEHKCSAMKIYFRETLTYKLVLDEILNSQTHYYHRWTRATALHALTFYTGAEKKIWLQNAVADSDFLLSQTATKVLHLQPSI